MLHKGYDRPTDTLLPAHQLVGRLNADIVVERSSPVVRAGTVFTDHLRIRNGDVEGERPTVWRTVTCGLKICAAEGEVLRQDLGRTALPHDVPASGQIEVGVAVPGEPPTGHYALRYDMVLRINGEREDGHSFATTTELLVFRSRGGPAHRRFGPERRGFDSRTLTVLAVLDAPSGNGARNPGCAPAQTEVADTPFDRKPHCDARRGEWSHWRPVSLPQRRARERVRGFGGRSPPDKT